MTSTEAVQTLERLRSAIAYSGADGSTLRCDFIAADIETLERAAAIMAALDNDTYEEGSY